MAEDHRERTSQPLKEPPLWVGMAFSIVFIILTVLWPGVAAVLIFLLLLVVFILFGATYPYYGGVSDEKK